MNNVSKSIMWTGIISIIITGIIHFIDAPDAFGESTYKSVLFTLNGIGALVAAVGIFRGASWGWLLGLLVAGGAIVGYIISRTVGLPGLEIDPEWLEPIGVVSLIAEGIFVALAAKALTKK
ncbi:MAG: hypothetical protein LH614_17185 [Pyrinomonadaceae bacterium]|nr:hypothetical protein [Pyrinomonadaceae bacterium]